MLKNWIKKIIKYNKKPFVTTGSILDFHIHPSALIYNQSNITIHKTALVAEFVIIRSPTSKLTIGENSQIGPFSVLINGPCGIIIGNNVMIAPHCVIASGVHEFRNLNIPMINAGSYSNGPIIIEDDVWIGANCTILDNVKIGKGAIIGANSLVNRDVNTMEIYGGVPAKYLNTRLKYKKPE